MQPTNHQGKRYGKLVVLHFTKKRLRGMAVWLCRCDCGKLKLVAGPYLTRGTKSCGCLIGKNIKHGGVGTTTYASWSSMWRRYHNRNSYIHKKGIKICELWERYANFLADMGEKPKGQRISIDRIDNNGNYEPGNCRWATPRDQARNRASARIVEYKGERKSVVLWAEQYGVKYNTLLRRLNAGWQIENAFVVPA